MSCTPFFSHMKTSPTFLLVFNVVTFCSRVRRGISIRERPFTRHKDSTDSKDTGLPLFFLSVDHCKSRETWTTRVETSDSGTLETRPVTTQCDSGVAGDSPSDDSM